MPKKTGITFETVQRLASRFPGVENGTSYGTPALKVKGKFMARLREDGDSVAFRVPFEQRDILMQSKPSVFFVTDHYLGYPAVLLRLPAATEKDASIVIDAAWRFVAPKRLIASFDAV